MIAIMAEQWCLLQSPRDVVCWPLGRNLYYLNDTTVCLWLDDSTKNLKDVWPCWRMFRKVQIKLNCLNSYDHPHYCIVFRILKWHYPFSRFSCFPAMCKSGAIQAILALAQYFLLHNGFNRGTTFRYLQFTHFLRFLRLFHFQLVLCGGFTNMPLGIVCQDYHTRVCAMAGHTMKTKFIWYRQMFWENKLFLEVVGWSSP